MASRNRKILILDTVRSMCYPSSTAEAHISSPQPSQPPPGTPGRSDGLCGPRGERLSRAGQHNLQ